MRKINNFRSKISAYFHKSRDFQALWHTLVFWFSLFTTFYCAITFKDKLIDLIKFIDDPAKTHTFADWCIFAITALIVLLFTSFVVLSGAYAKNRLLEILKEIFAYKEKKSADENPLSLWERGRGEGASEATELHIETKAIKRKVKRFRSCGASYFSLLVQRKVTKRKHTQPSRPPR